MDAGALIELDGQYRALREEAGFLVREGRGQIDVTGPDAADYLQGQLTQEIEAIEPGSGAYSALLDRKGHMQGDMRVLAVAPDELRLDLEPEALSPVLRHLSVYKVGRDVEVADRSSERAVVSVIGPGAVRIVEAPPLGPEHSHAEHAIGGIECRAVATDIGLDLICAADDLATLGAALANGGLAPVSDEAAEIVRVESGRPRFAREMTTETIPQEAGINGRAVSFEKGCYIGQETVARLHYKGKPNRHLRGLRSEERLAAGEELSLDGKLLGVVGTAVISPALGPLALAIVRREAQPGTTIDGRDGRAISVVELPFAA